MKTQMSSGIENRRRREMATFNTDCANNMPSFGEEISIAESAGKYYTYSETKTCEEYAPYYPYLMASNDCFAGKYSK